MGNWDYTGHPLVDVGLATLTAFARKRHPRQLTQEDLRTAAQYMAANYVVEPLKSFLTVAFPNSGFTQPAYNRAPQKRRIYAQKVLVAPLDAETTREFDPLTGQRAVHLPLDIKDQLPPGRAYRQHVPLLTREGVINFFPYGDAGLPVSAMTLLAIQALPLGCAKVGGRLLALHSDDPDLLLRFARTFLQTNLQNIQAAQAAGDTKLPDTSPRRPRTLLVEHLEHALRERARNKGAAFPPSVTGYYFTNRGKEAEIVIFPLPLEVSDFLRAVQHPAYREAWNALVQRGWEGAYARKRTRRTSPPRYNRLYEELFALPDQAAAFIRRYFLRRRARRIWDKRDPTQYYDPRQEAHLISWPLTQLFLRKVVRMDQERIEHIRALGDALAEYIIRHNDARFLHQLLLSRAYAPLRMLLLRASYREIRRGRPPLVTLERFLAVFEQDEGIPRSDWRLGRDLVFIRLFEQLHANGWLQQHLEVLSDLDDTDEVTDE
ncbi:MAG: type I-B CRISPR-associated protein Cas8b1/Cst1 [Chloroflexi bacterium]|nr:type I-B CRISPR-associated protein Cas8b1/Cst1 [Chloroflexota bacterium]